MLWWSGYVGLRPCRLRGQGVTRFYPPKPSSSHWRCLKTDLKLVPRFLLPVVQYGLLVSFDSGGRRYKHVLASARCAAAERLKSGCVGKHLLQIATRMSRI